MEEKRQDKTRGETKRADKRQDEKEERRNYDFFQKMFEDPQTRQMNYLHMFRKKKTFGRIITQFFFESSESGRFFNYLHDSNSIFRARVNEFRDICRAARYRPP